MKNFIPLFAVILLTVTFLTFWDSQPEYFIDKADKASLTEEVLKADSYMSRVEMTRFADSGAPEILLTASQSRFFEKKHYAEMDNPHLTAFNEEDEGLPWELTAENGVAYTNSDKLVFTDKVHLWQYAQIDTLNELLTEQLTVYSEKKTAHSDTVVTITTPRGTTIGRTMDANLAKKTFTLHNDVKGVHVGL